jgi:CRISPR-associated protein Csd1
MILQALNSYYDRLEQDPTIGIAPYGFSRQQIAFCITLNSNGSLHAIDDIRERDGKKPVARSLVVLGNAKPSGSGINPGFLWDNPAYMLGYKADDEKPERTRESFAEFRKRHLDAEAAIDDPEFSAVCRFLEKWNPAEAGQYPSLIEISTGFGVFRIRAADHYVHDQKVVREWWRQHLTVAEADADSTIGQCLVTGQVGSLARLHEPKIKGVWGAQSSGAAIVSFNLDAFESYGKEQSLNSPVSEQAAFQYCTALNHLLRTNSPQRVQIGDASTVFWTERPTEAENLLPWVFEPNKDTENEALKNRIQSVLRSIASGSYADEFGNPDTPFYVLGLSPNAARISVRFWWVSTLQGVFDNLHDHFADLQLDHSDRDPEFPAIWQLIRETVRESKDIPPLLGGAVLRSVLTGTPYPSMLFSALLRRIRADREVRYLRAAVIKAYLNRNIRFGINPLQKEISMSLDPDRPEPSYHMGRFFAELEHTQKDALPDINATIKDRYFGAASTTPSSVFPRLIRLSQHHLGKLDVGKRTYHEKRFQDIVGKVDDFPAHLNLQHQGLFAIGYYHQRQDIFTKKPSSKSEKE